jgi:hypothetical protein
VYKQLGGKYHVTFKHAIEPVRKSYLAENFRKLEPALLETTVTPFRDVNNLQRIVMPLYDNFYGRNTIVLNWRTGKRRIVYQYRRDSLFRRFCHDLVRVTATIFGVVKYDCCDKQHNLIQRIKRYQPALFAINDFSERKASFEQASALIQSLFPLKSEFEK